jgi:hypothetical protein
MGDLLAARVGDFAERDGALADFFFATADFREGLAWGMVRELRGKWGRILPFWKDGMGNATRDRPGGAVK